MTESQPRAKARKTKAQQQQEQINELSIFVQKQQEQISELTKQVLQLTNGLHGLTTAVQKNIIQGSKQ